ncbi:hypothetical protein G9A89_010475 [Geosiphon pyriformis]|nr:hypothetical protein G9A89_010475 [Geosiphon pyriformis]
MSKNKTPNQVGDFQPCQFTNQSELNGSLNEKKNVCGAIKILEKAFELYSKVAEAGDLVSQYCLELYFYSGSGTIKHLEKVENPSPQNNLGTRRRNEWGTMKNPEKTFELYSKTAERENTTALYTLGWCYQNGRGTA